MAATQPTLAHTFCAYARLRTRATYCSIGHLHQPRFPAATLLVDIPQHCAFNNAIALLCYDFVYADFIRSMSHLYTYQGRDHDMVWDIINSVTHIPQAPNWPSIDFDHTFQAMTLGVPLMGHFQCQFHSVAQRNLYDNHSTIKTPEVCEAVRKKFIKEEDLSYNVVFPHCLSVHPRVIPQPSHVCPPKIRGRHGTHLCQWYQQAVCYR